MHGLPLTYGKDMQEDKEPFFDAVDTLEQSLDMAEGMLSGISFDRERLAAASADEMLAATEIADLLVRRGVPFREAHEIVGSIVRHAIEQDKTLSELDADELKGFSEQLDEEYYEVLRSSNWLESKRSEGGTSSKRISQQLASARKVLDGVEKTLRHERS
jgi:argininosuccinate lyase